MARINLLPWRVERRKQQQKEAMTALGFVALAAGLLSFLIIAFYNGHISGQEDRNEFLTAQIAELDQQISEIKSLDEQRERLVARKEVIEKLQSSRSQMVHLFDSLVRTIPDGVVLTSIKQDNDILTLEGRAQSNARVSAYLRNLEGSGWMTQPDLAIIEARGTNEGLPYSFSLQVKLVTPTKAEGDIPSTDDVGTAVPAAETPTPVVDTPVIPESEAAPEVNTTPEEAGANDSTPTVMDEAATLQEPVATQAPDQAPASTDNGATP